MASSRKDFKKRKLQKSRFVEPATPSRKKIKISCDQEERNNEETTFLALPTDIVLHVLSYLGLENVTIALQMMSVCKQWYRLISHHLQRLAVFMPDIPNTDLNKLVSRFRNVKSLLIQALIKTATHFSNLSMQCSSLPPGLLSLEIYRLRQPQLSLSHELSLLTQRLTRLGIENLQMSNRVEYYYPLTALTSLRTLELKIIRDTTHAFDPNDCEFLTHFVNLRVLTLDGFSFSDSCAKVLTNLEELSLYRPEYVSKDLSHLVHLQSLNLPSKRQQLQLSHICSFPRLTRLLYAGIVKISSYADFTHLVNLTSLKILTAASNADATTESGPLCLYPLTQLEAISFERHTLDRSLLFKNLPCLTNIVDLSIENCYLMNLVLLSSLQYLRNLIKLKFANVMLVSFNELSLPLEWFIHTLDDNAMQYFSTLTTLKTLIFDSATKKAQFHNPQFTGSGLMYISHLSNLTVLSLKFNNVTDENLKYLFYFSCLEVLSLRQNAQLTDFGIRKIISFCFPRLRVLDVSGCKKLTSGAFIYFSRLTNLQRLYLDETNISGGCLKIFVKLPCLQLLSLNDCSNLLFDKDIKPLSRKIRTDQKYLSVFIGHNVSSLK
jgi:hypothetical protein